MMQYHSRLRRSSTAEAHMDSGSDMKMAESDSSSHEVQQLVSVMKLLSLWLDVLWHPFLTQH